jgi:hypothetical protein
MPTCCPTRFDRVLQALLLVALIPFSVACGSDDGPVDATPPPQEASEQVVQTRDGVLTATLPMDLVVHAHSDTLLATSADGAQRVFLRHRPHDTLVRIVGRAKDSLVARGWKMTKEQHLENAVLLESRAIEGKRPILRGAWYVEREHRILECEVIEPEHRARQLLRSLRRLCQLVRMTPGPAPGSPVDDAVPGVSE